MVDCRSQRNPSVANTRFINRSASRSVVCRTIVYSSIASHVGHKRASTPANHASNSGSASAGQAKPRKISNLGRYSTLTTTTGNYKRQNLEPQGTQGSQRIAKNALFPLCFLCVPLWLRCWPAPSLTTQGHRSSAETAASVELSSTAQTNKQSSAE